MKNKIITSFLITALLNFLTGCSTTGKISKSEITQDEFITEAVLLNLDIIKFDDKGGKYLTSSPQITGTLVNGKPFRASVELVKEIRTSVVSPIDLSELDNQKILEIHLNNGMVVITDSAGAFYNKDNKTISGNSDNNTHFEIKIDKISKIFTERPDIIQLTDKTSNDSIIIKEVISNSSNKLYTFNENGGRIGDKRQIIKGYTAAGDLVEIDQDSVLYFNVHRAEPVGTVLTILGVTAGVAAVVFIIALATKESCPFIYSFDGNNYVFDAEPLGGATCKGFERTEYSKLDYLKNKSGTCRILLRNDVDETQYIDEVGLLTVKHDRDKSVVPDLDRNFYQIKKPVTPSSAKDEKGLDLIKAVSTSDNLHWQTKLPVDNSLFNSKYRHELIFTFPRPADKTKAKLIANFGTTLWGSEMIKQMLQLYGSNIDSYYESINRKGVDYNQVMNFIESEELYKLKYYTKSENGWTYQGFINGGGPFVTETRAYDLDLSNVKGDSIVIKMNPPYGFWSVDYLAIEYENYPAPVVQTIMPDKVFDHNEKNSKDIITHKDNNYYIMPNVGDFLEISFLAEKCEQQDISYYLQTSGYYEVHINKNAQSQFAILKRLVSEPGYIVKYSNEKYRSWKDNLDAGVINNVK